MLQTILSSERGGADHGWLKAKHSFSFSQYFNPARMGFGPLRVINEDLVAPTMGFGTHGHQDMEIITYILDGELSHRDSMGNQAAILKGQVQKMSAGRGVRHSEFNSRDDSSTHFLQIWIEPNVTGIEPEYEQQNLSDLPVHNGWRVIAAPNGLWLGQTGAFRLYQDAVFLVAHADDGLSERHYALDNQRLAYIHVATGSATVNGVRLSAGDAVQMSDESSVDVVLSEGAQVLLFDLPVTA
jgi:redox-sensitive bicupin YhaK (pirin superfamily)